MEDDAGKPSGVRGHARWVRVSHWIVTVSVFVLVFSGFEILMVHPRLYWGIAGNDLTPALLELPISRNYKHRGFDTPKPFFQDAAGPVSASRTYEIFNQNGWGRSLTSWPRGFSCCRASCTCSSESSAATFAAHLAEAAEARAAPGLARLRRSPAPPGSAAAEARSTGCSRRSRTRS